MSALSKLPGYLPQLVGKTIAHNMLIFYQGGQFQLWQFYTDGTSYEFYGRGDVSGPHMAQMSMDVTDESAPSH